MELFAFFVVAGLLWWAYVMFQKHEREEQARQDALHKAWVDSIKREVQQSPTPIPSTPALPASVSGLVNKKPFFDPPYVAPRPVYSRRPPAPVETRTIIYTPPPAVQNSGPSFGSMVGANLAAEVISSGAKAIFNSAREYVEEVEPRAPSWSSGGGGSFDGGGASDSWGSSSSDYSSSSSSSSSYSSSDSLDSSSSSFGD